MSRQVNRIYGVVPAPGLADAINFYHEHEAIGAAVRPFVNSGGDFKFGKRADGDLAGIENARTR